MVWTRDWTETGKWYTTCLTQFNMEGEVSWSELKQGNWYTTCLTQFKRPGWVSWSELGTELKQGNWYTTCLTQFNMEGEVSWSELKQGNWYTTCLTQFKRPGWVSWSELKQGNWYTTCLTQFNRERGVSWSKLKRRLVYNMFNTVWVSGILVSLWVTGKIRERVKSLCVCVCVCVCVYACVHVCVCVFSRKTEKVYQVNLFDTMWFCLFWDGTALYNYPNMWIMWENKKQNNHLTMPTMSATKQEHNPTISIMQQCHIACTHWPSLTLMYAQKTSNTHTDLAKHYCVHTKMEIAHTRAHTHRHTRAHTHTLT